MQNNNIFCKILNVNGAILALIKKSESDLIMLLNVPAEFSKSDICMVVLDQPSQYRYSKYRVKKTNYDLDYKTLTLKVCCSL